MRQGGTRPRVGWSWVKSGRQCFQKAVTGRPPPGVAPLRPRRAGPSHTPPQHRSEAPLGGKGGTGAQDELCLMLTRSQQGARCLHTAQPGPRLRPPERSFSCWRQARLAPSPSSSQSLAARCSRAPSTPVVRIGRVGIPSTHTSQEHRATPVLWLPPCVPLPPVKPLDFLRQHRWREGTRLTVANSFSRSAFMARMRASSSATRSPDMARMKVARLETSSPRPQAKWPTTSQQGPWWWQRVWLQHCS